MSFINSLFKGFIRSAVNQVGRDGGKVISNQVYGDSHSKPIRIVDNSHKQSKAHIESRENLISRGDVEAEGLKAMSVKLNIQNTVFGFIVSLFIPLVGPLYWLYNSLSSILTKSIPFYNISQVGIYKQDRRYKTGRRLEGYRTVKQKTNIKADPTDKEKSQLKLNSIVYLILAAIVGFAQYSFFYENVSNPENASKNEVDFKYAVVSSNSGLNLRSDSSLNATIITSIPNNDTVKIIKGTDKWLLVDYKENEGWVSKKYLVSIQEN
ncbi:SH3 domain-containing protein [Marivirga salinae]|uniref:SH3 domain-containing protein n=1 Tax=Marivirga salinarum TaxID=3059078 RepID=A0AA51NEM2_9BACT|nr:SH3 domain-containing protein [Marivirga sp. BDSF4-3]WMN12986.1 SH3 domain-containing protein [Marivirga sp. BDSF4-3]